MSLKDTIRGAREEVGANGNPFSRSDSKGSDEASGDTAKAGKRVGSRRTMAKAKPTREAAAGVRVVSSSGKTKSGKANMTKAERKAERRSEREREDRRYTLSQAYLDEDEVYKKSRKVWWIFLGVGMVLIVIAFTLNGIVTQTTQSGQEANPAFAYVSMAAMVLAYISIIGGMVYDFVKIRPQRKKIESRVASMSDKRVKTVLNQRAREQAAKK